MRLIKVHRSAAKAKQPAAANIFNTISDAAILLLQHPDWRFNEAVLRYLSGLRLFQVANSFFTVCFQINTSGSVQRLWVSRFCLLSKLVPDKLLAI